jgi:hypothetical protein
VYFLLSLNSLWNSLRHATYAIVMFADTFWEVVGDDGSRVRLHCC